MPGILNLNYVTFDQILKEDVFNQATPIFDLRKVRLVTPSGLVQLVSACYAMSQVGKRPRIVLRNVDVRSYMARMGLNKVLEEIADIQPPLPLFSFIFFEQFKGKSLKVLELTKIKSSTDIPAIIEHIGQTLEKRFNYTSRERSKIKNAISEVCQNTFEHNTDCCGFIGMQVYQNDSGSFLEVAISDYGQGLRSSLNTNPDLKGIETDHDAITAALTLKVSRIPNDPTRGTGLHHLKVIMDKYGDHLNIRSGTAKVHFRIKSHEIFKHEAPFMPGVHVCFSLRARTK